MRLEHSPCNLCGGDDAAPFLEKDGFSIVRCRRCGLVYVNPRPSAEDLRSLYEDPGYFSGTEWYLDYVGNEANYRRLFRRLLDTIDRHLPKPGRLLDVGCAAGFLLDLARARGWEVSGVEISPAMVDYAKRRFGLPIERGDLLDARFPEGRVDAVTFCDSLEHVEDPLGTLREARRVVRPGGILLIVTPNVESLPARLMGRHWPHLTPREHIYYFGRQTLRRLVEEAGFARLAERSITHTWSLEEIIRKLLPVADSITRRRGLRGLLRMPVSLNVGDTLLVAKAPS